MTVDNGAPSTTEFTPAARLHAVTTAQTADDNAHDDSSASPFFSRRDRRRNHPASGWCRIEGGQAEGITDPLTRNGVPFRVFDASVFVQVDDLEAALLALTA